MKIWQELTKISKIALRDDFPAISDDFEDDYQRAKVHGCHCGTWGTAKYYIDADHNMYLGTGELQGRLYDAVGGSHAHDLNTIHIRENVRAPQDSSHLLSVTDEIYTSEKAFLLAIYGIDKLDTSRTINMHGMFANDYLLTSLDLSSWDTSQVRDMSQMFHGLASLKYLNVRDWNTQNVLTMRGTFAGVSSLTDLDITLWETAQVQDMAWMFTDTNSLYHLDLSQMDMSQVQDVRSMFLWMDQSTAIQLNPTMDLSDISAINDKNIVTSKS